MGFCQWHFSPSPHLNLLPSPVWSMWVISSQLQWTRPKCLIIILAQSLPREHLKPASLEESLTWSTPLIADVILDVDEVYKVLCGIDPSKARPVVLMRFLVDFWEREHHGLRNQLPNCIPCLCSQDPFLEIGEEPMLLQCLRVITNTLLPTIVILFGVYLNSCFFLVPPFFFSLVASCTWGSTYYRPGPLVQPFLSEIYSNSI